MSAITITIGFMVVFISAMWFVSSNRENNSRVMLLPNRVMTLFPDPKPLQVFSLTDHQSQLFDLSRLRNKWSFIFFGYTHCPDICLTTMAELARTYKVLVKNSVKVDDVQFVFVSVDPARDNSDILSQYVGYFHQTFLGVSGDDSQISNLASQLGAVYQIPVNSGTLNYSVSHSSAVFLIDPRVRYYAVIRPPFDANSISARFKSVRQFEQEARNGIRIE